jgi:hypothetical protein
LLIQGQKEVFSLFWNGFKKKKKGKNINKVCTIPKIQEGEKQHCLNMP